MHFLQNPCLQGIFPSGIVLGYNFRLSDEGWASCSWQKLNPTSPEAGEELWEPLGAAQGVGRSQFFSFSRKSSNISAPQSFTSLSSCQFISLAGKQVNRTDLSNPRKAEEATKQNKKGKKKHNQHNRWFFFPSIKHEKVEFEIKQHHLYQGTPLQIFSALFLKGLMVFYVINEGNVNWFFTVGFHWSREGKVGSARMWGLGHKTTFLRLWKIPKGIPGASQKECFLIWGKPPACKTQTNWVPGCWNPQWELSSPISCCVLCRINP